jgi:hypothetical protein
MATNKNLIIEGAEILFRNFAGAESKFNAKGNRNFCVILDQRTANECLKEGWNVKYLKPRDEDDEERPYISVSVSYDNIPPKVVLVSGKKKTIMTADTIEILDWAELINVDVVIRPYNWQVNSSSGVKGYLKTMYVTVEPDEFEDKYADEDEN